MNAQRNLSLVRGLAAAALLCLGFNAIAVTCSGPSVALPSLCGVSLTAPTVSCTVPLDAQQNPASAPLYVTQRATNIFSWQAFIGLQWPASTTQRGQPNRSAPLGAPGPAVWETWRETSEVFRSDGNGNPLPPLAWNAPSTVPAQCAGADRVLFRSSKVDDLLTDVSQPTGATATRPLSLKNQSGQQTRYEVRMNQTAYNAITAPQNQWWNGANQADLNSVLFPVGSMMVKAAWTPVTAAKSARFRTINACVCDGSAPNSPCAVKKMGLTGFHLMSKTPSAPQWLWSTFEQQDNVPPTACASPMPPMPVGTPGPTYWNVKQGLANANQQTVMRIANQICREIAIPTINPACGVKDDSRDNVAAVNTAMQAALAKTRLSRYLLVNTQWPLPGAGEPGVNTTFKVLPTLLGNTTLESFIQDTSSCMGCHAMARTRRQASLNPLDRGFVSSDFTFMLGLASPALKPAPKLSPLTAKDCTGNNATDPKCVGLKVATDTYNQLPHNTHAKLHCTSCHLSEGRNPRASWWAGMPAKYQSLPGGLAGRINQCFSNSLNGTALCTPNAQGQCPDNPQMTGLIAYMTFLSDPAQNPLAIAPPANAFPTLPNGVGRASQGAETYLQKCAFCHGKNGEGRYMDNTYFRPALWGAQSYNHRAGMSAAGDLAPFIYGNMPLHSGGELTSQEAMDLACYIDTQPRPAGGTTESTVSSTGTLTCAPN